MKSHNPLICFLEFVDKNVELYILQANPNTTESLIPGYITAKYLHQSLCPPSVYDLQFEQKVLSSIGLLCLPLFDFTVLVLYIFIVEPRSVKTSETLKCLNCELLVGCRDYEVPWGFN